MGGDDFSDDSCRRPRTLRSALESFSKAICSVVSCSVGKEFCRHGTSDCGLWAHLDVEEASLECWKQRLNLLDTVLSELSDVHRKNVCSNDEGCSLHKVAVDVAGLHVTATVSSCQLWWVYLPLVSLALVHLESHPRTRTILGVSGPAGSGKSVSAAILHRMLSMLGVDSAVVAMDAYLFPSSKLNATSLPDGSGDVLASVKGRPETMDLPAFSSDLRSLRDRSQVVHLPFYDRNIHDPVPGAIVVKPTDGIILVEGLYLAYDRHGWCNIHSLLDISVYLDVPLEECRSRVVERKILGGLTREEACSRYDRNDLKTFHELQRSKSNANIVIANSLLCAQGHGNA